MPANGDTVPIPTSVNTESQELDLGIGPSISVRQLLSMVISMMLWMVLGYSILGGIIGVVWIGLLFTIWIPVAGLMLAFRKKDDQPYEVYLANKIIRMIDGDKYVLKRRDDSLDLQNMRFYDEEDVI